MWVDSDGAGSGIRVSRLQVHAIYVLHPACSLVSCLPKLRDFLLIDCYFPDALPTCYPSFMQLVWFCPLIMPLVHSFVCVCVCDTYHKYNGL